jgi:hypothetical protein
MRMPQPGSLRWVCPRTFGNTSAGEDRRKLRNYHPDRLSRSQPSRLDREHRAPVRRVRGDRATGGRPQDHETHAGPTFGECREKAPQKYPSLSVPDRDLATKTHKGLPRDSF